MQTSEHTIFQPKTGDILGASYATLHRGIFKLSTPVDRTTFDSFLQGFMRGSLLRHFKDQPFDGFELLIVFGNQYLVVPKPTAGKGTHNKCVSVHVSPV